MRILIVRVAARPVLPTDMNLNALKSYARKARHEFVAAVTVQAQLLGLTPGGIVEAKRQGDVFLIGPHAFSADIAPSRQRIADRIQRDGFEHVMDEMAYTWFNRFVAIRFMELHGYLDHGFRVLSHPDGHEEPEILRHITEVHLPELDRKRAIQLKLDGARDEELYRLILLAQCNALHRAIPQLFERVQGESELLLPANLLHSKSVIRGLVQEIGEDDWEDIEVIGWLYQFYISERKDAVMGSVVKTTDIPAATQLFTPNWIVKYLVQNSLGALWTTAHTESALLDQMPYYIPRANSGNVISPPPPPHAYNKHLLNPEDITLLDPACGSGHMLLEAYELLRTIYLERGYRRRDLARLILEKNLFGLDIDRRATQLAAFCLVMKGRADDARLFEKRLQLNVLPIADSTGLGDMLASEPVASEELGTELATLQELVAVFKDGATFGTLIRLPLRLAGRMPDLNRTISRLRQRVGLFSAGIATHVAHLVRQAELLVQQYDVVVANPPYMGSNAMNATLKAFVRHQYPSAKKDLFSCFIERSCELTKPHGFAALVTMHNWMFIASFEQMRRSLLRTRAIRTLAHLGARAFESIGGEVVQTAAFVLQNVPPADHMPIFVRLVERPLRRKAAGSAKRCPSVLQHPSAPISSDSGLPGVLLAEQESVCSL